MLASLAVSTHIVNRLGILRPVAAESSRVDGVHQHLKHTLLFLPGCFTVHWLRLLLDGQVEACKMNMMKLVQARRMDFTLECWTDLQ